MDSTGLRMHGGNDWCNTKHGGKKPNKTWRKLHIALDSEKGEILESFLTTEHVGDQTALPSSLAKMDFDVERFLADGAYDGKGVFDCLVANFGTDIEFVIPPPKNAVEGGNTQRDQHIKDIAEHGRMKWQFCTGCNLRSLVEAEIGRWKEVLGGGLEARHFDNQACEIRIGTKGRWCMTSLGRANYERVF